MKEELQYYYDSLIMARDKAKASENLLRTKESFYLECWVISKSKDKVQKLLEEKPRFGELSQHANESIGLKNINARIRLYYGEDYGLSVKSEQGCGTTVQIKIPELAEETKEEA